MKSASLFLAAITLCLIVFFEPANESQAPAPNGEPVEIPQQYREFTTRTMTEYYEEISNGQFTLAGKVYPWKKLPERDVFYEGLGGATPFCNGLCEASKVGELIEQIAAANDDEILKGHCAKGELRGVGTVGVLTWTRPRS